ncbi:pentatricopeptide repeat-containing protein At1g62350-like [Telopea speciosissima]|uniref:pentatricopeptide repeat-containing protein At1g62350-like n=1 Tax=Telopea speciosissima TaxID=54955 RepID=UPI001CC5B4D4|nr:pentatricopeptide repeat-containing protein At1g62350-like [Telopea speciosissima]
MHSHVSHLLKTDLFAVLAELQRQDQVFLAMKIYEVVRKEIWYRPDMFLYRDMLMMLARNKKVDEAKRVWEDLRREEVLFDHHTYGDIIRSFLDGGLPLEAMELYDEMRRSPDPPISLPYRVILKGLIPYPELREKVKEDFLELFPSMIVYDPPEDLFDDQQPIKESEDD